MSSSPTNLFPEFESAVTALFNSLIFLLYSSFLASLSFCSSSSFAASKEALLTLEVSLDWDSFVALTKLSFSLPVCPKSVLSFFPIYFVRIRATAITATAIPPTNINLFFFLFCSCGSTCITGVSDAEALDIVLSAFTTGVEITLISLGLISLP